MPRITKYFPELNTLFLKNKMSNRPRVLLATNRNPNFETITEYIERALGEFTSLETFDDRSFWFPCRLRKRAPMLGSWDLARMNRRLVARAREFHPQLFFVAGGHRIFPATIYQIKAMGVKTVLWTIDAPRDFAPIAQTAPAYDHVFCGGSEAMELLTGVVSAEKLHFLPFACDLKWMNIEPSSDERKQYECDIAFVGSYYPNRQAIFEQISEYELGIWGPGWNRAKLSPQLRRCVRNSVGITPLEWVKIYKSSKIMLAVHFCEEGISCHQVSPKVYEALSCRSFVLSDDQRDLRTIFQVGKHLEVFTSVQELKSKIDFHLEHPEMRQEIALCGHEEVLAHHTYTHRVKQLWAAVFSE
jgi:spore maturation protein CgeB